MSETKVIPSYPKHLSHDEREAVRERAVRLKAEEMVAQFSNPLSPASLDFVCRAVAPALVAHAWQRDRIAELEQRLEDLEATAARKRKVSKP